MQKKLSRRMLRLAAVSTEIAKKAWARAGPTSTGQPRTVMFEPSDGGNGALRIVVTGGAKGVGRALAEGFSAEGCRVAITSRKASDAEEAAGEIGNGAIGLACDVTDQNGVHQVFDQIASRLGGIDILINNAGITGPLGDAAQGLSCAEFTQVLEVNATGAYLASHAAAGHMETSGGGRILNVSSGAVDRTEPGMGAYSVSKHALEGVTRQLARDLAGKSIAVCSIRLGSVRTDMTEKAFGKLKSSLLPEPISLFPAFKALVRSPAFSVNGRSFAGWRLLADPMAEILAPTPLSQVKPFHYPTYEHNGRKVSREDESFHVYDRAENQFGPSPSVAKVLRAELDTRPIAIYPDESHTDLRRTLAEIHDLPDECFSIGNGSWEVLDRLLEMFTTPGDDVVTSRPGWFGFKMLADKRALSIVGVPLKRGAENWDYDLKAVSGSVTPTTRLVYLISPSNPEGVVLRRDDMRRFLGELPPGLPVVLDEAYFEYVDDPDAVSTRDLLDFTTRPIFGLRTFSKFYGLASMRVGYAYGRAEFISLLNRGERIFNISHLSEKAAVAALRDDRWNTHIQATTSEERHRLQDGFKDLGLAFIPSQAPFILVEVPGDLSRTIEYFAGHGIYLGEKAFYKGKFMLFPVSTPEENIRHLELLRQYI
ncbi:MAG: SDR family NAD(P)-dependent oxidoreductase [Maritimibacter sp.]|nr:SDR family NAD(P)-dependent oxidoreductase [Maritimibacter sp.]